MLITGALPAALAMTIVALTTDDDQVVRVELVSDRAAVACPACGTLTTRVHSRYQRTLADLPWQGLPVQLCLTTRRFFCEQAACPQQLFAERFPGLAAPRGRRSARLQTLVTAIGVALGGEAGARLVTELGLLLSPDTLLRSVRALPELTLAPPRVVGIDDWAFRKGHRYGTLLVDLERREVIDLLPDRNADTVVQWLAEHPGVQVISRDRGRVYADGARRGAPNAVQVADRFHLVKNLGEALERLLLHERAALQAAAGEASAEPAPLKTYGGAERTPSQEREEQASRAKHAPKLAQYAEIQRLHAAGATIKHIAETVGVSRPTVYRYLRLVGPPERKRPHRSRHLLTPYEPFLRQRWEAGCHIKAQLLREVREQGYTHSTRTVYRFLKQVERTDLQATATPATARVEVPSPRHVATLLVRRPERMSVDDRAYLSRLCEQTPSIATAYTLTQDFATMVRERQGQRLDGWLTQAKESGLKELAAYARGIESDYAAVAAGLRLPWSNGQTEGQVNKLKLVKRQMYGRANFDLLRLRVLHVA